jgi:hypothetical protein
MTRAPRDITPPAAQDLAQLEDVVENLRQQRPTFSSSDVVAAIDFYWKNDAFIDLSDGLT